MAYKAKNDLAGRVFGKLTVLRRVGANRHGQSLWLCRCECGRESSVIRSNLLRGHSQSCRHHNQPPTVHLKERIEALEGVLSAAILALNDAQAIMPDEVLEYVTPKMDAENRLYRAKHCANGGQSSGQ